MENQVKKYKIRMGWLNNPDQIKEDLQYMNNIRLYPTSEAVWRRHNAGSISKDTKSHY